MNLKREETMKLNQFLLATLVAIVATYNVSADVVITEYIQNVAGDEDNTEWFEVFNAGPSDVNLSTLTFGDNSGGDVGPDFVLVSGAYAIFVNGSTADFINAWGVGIAGVNVFQSPQIGNLSNSGDFITAGSIVLTYDNGEDAGQSTYLDEGYDFNNGNPAYDLEYSGGDIITPNWNHDNRSVNDITSTNGDVGTPLSGGYIAVAIPEPTSSLVIAASMLFAATRRRK
ncbi:MAG: lamin tail domain-containing protein [Planctomycetota bacterium]